ncbi:hypothetical protein SAMN04487898_12260 [Pedobacter sp. ok626]|uniref:hypothetical protein n=1 Tax=Pedobacter sp. ok626 TaxID=1761882 RepID=UPI00088E60A6|nr:hypothetical protein [Pedobacter sp. ok626]SDL66333.1 hypothetical protein SAMN04487898_12260 [Pedobacter sp. ok626]
MKLYIILSLVLAVLFTSCKKETTLEPSLLDKNFLSVQDNPSDPVDHEIYNIYIKYGVPIFYNDTVIREQRFDASGKSFMYYETLAVNYALTGTTSAGTVAPLPDYYKIPAAKTSLMPLILFIRDEVISKLPKGIYVPSILLLDSLNSLSSGTFAVRGLNTIGISKGNKFSTLNATSKNILRAAVLRSMVSTFINSDANATWLSTNFLNISRAFYTTADVYSSTKSQLELSKVYFANSGFNKPEQIGFLGKYSGEDYGFPRTPTIAQDINMYLEAVFANTTAQFTATYGSYVPVMLKYNRIKTKLVEMGFTFN